MTRAVGPIERHPSDVEHRGEAVALRCGDAVRGGGVAPATDDTSGPGDHLGGDVGCQPSRRSVVDESDSADLVIAAEATALQARLYMRNVEHFPMFDGLSAPC